MHPHPPSSSPPWAVPMLGGLSGPPFFSPPPKQPPIHCARVGWCPPFQKNILPWHHARGGDDDDDGLGVLFTATGRWEGAGGGRRPPRAPPPFNPKNNKNQKISRVRGRVGERGRRRAGASPSLPATLLLDLFFLSFSLRLVSFHPITGGESACARACAPLCMHARLRARASPPTQKKKGVFLWGARPGPSPVVPPAFFPHPTNHSACARAHAYVLRASARRAHACFFLPLGWGERER